MGQGLLCNVSDASGFQHCAGACRRGRGPRPGVENAPVWSTLRIPHYFKQVKELMGEEIKVNTESLLRKIRQAAEDHCMYPDAIDNIIQSSTMDDLGFDDLDILYLVMSLEELTSTDIEGEVSDFKTVQDVIDAMVKAGITE